MFKVVDKLLSDKPRGAIYEVRAKKEKYTPEEREKRRELYDEFLADALRQCSVLVRENSCPKEQLDNFTVLGLLRDGVFGAVFLVKHRSYIARYALKVQLKRNYTTPARRERVLYEKKIQYALRSEFIAKALFAFQDLDKLYLVVECGKYGNLCRFMNAKLPERMIKLIAAQIVLAIEYLHACSVSHRDVEPKNIQVYIDGYLKIGEFGFAKKFKDTQSTYTWVGSPMYMAPEMIDLRGHRKGIDWWSLGVILFQFLYQNHPFQYPGWTYKQVLKGITTAEIYFPKGVNQESSACRFVKALLEKEPSKRLGELLYGVEDIKHHVWFEDISFMEVLDKKILLNVKLKSVKPEKLGDHAHLVKMVKGELFPDGFEDF